MAMIMLPVIATTRNETDAEMTSRMFEEAQSGSVPTTTRQHVKIILDEYVNTAHIVIVSGQIPNYPKDYCQVELSSGNILSVSLSGAEVSMRINRAERGVIHG